MIGEDDLLHRRGQFEVLGGHIKDAREHEFELLGGAVLARLHEGKEVLLDERAGDLGKVQMPERRFQVHLEHSKVFLVCRRFRRLLLDGEPVAGVVRKENIFCGAALLLDGRVVRFGLARELCDELLFHRLEVLGSDLDVEPVAAVSRLKQAVVVAVSDELVVGNERLLERFRHGVQLLFREGQRAAAIVGFF